MPAPDPPIELLVGTNGHRALRVAARHADAWNWDAPMQAYGPPLEQLRAHCRSIGRDPSEIRLTAECAVDFPDDPEGFVAARPRMGTPSGRSAPPPRQPSSNSLRWSTPESSTS